MSKAKNAPEVGAITRVDLTVNDASARRCVERGGTILAGPREMGDRGRCCVKRDPAGAVAALFTPAK